MPLYPFERASKIASICVVLIFPCQKIEILQKEEINPAVRPVVKDLKKEKKSYKVDVLITLWPKLSKLPKLNQTVTVDSIAPTEEEIENQTERIKLQFADVAKVERPSKTSTSEGYKSECLLSTGSEL